ncbi:MAG: zf-TFIIB domain-containing protein [Desulfobacterales bacterium]
MNCPQCKQPMQNKQIGEIIIDECRTCRGIWFDPGEIEEVKDEVAPQLRWMDIELWRDNTDFKVEFDSLYCPRCLDVAMTALVDRKSDTTLRFCNVCNGFWLRAADFRQIIAALDQEADRLSATDYLKESLKQGGDLISGDTTLISDWKDLKMVLRLLKYRVFVEHRKLGSIVKGLQKSFPL